MRRPCAGPGLEQVTCPQVGERVGARGSFFIINECPYNSPPRRRRRRRRSAPAASVVPAPPTSRPPVPPCHSANLQHLHLAYAAPGLPTYRDSVHARGAGGAHLPHPPRCLHLHVLARPLAVPSGRLFLPSVINNPVPALPEAPALPNNSNLSCPPSALLVLHLSLRSVPELVVFTATTRRRHRPSAPAPPPLAPHSRHGQQVRSSVRAPCYPTMNGRTLDAVREQTPSALLCAARN